MTKDESGGAEKEPAKRYVVRREMTGGYAVVWSGYDERRAHEICSTYQDIVRTRGVFVEAVAA